MNNLASTRLLLRTKEVTSAVLQLADHLEAISGLAVALIVDASAGNVTSEIRPVINLSVAACSGLGLHCPADFAWKCGDYGYYLARQRFPDATLFWMVETDVRFCGDNPAYFFQFFAARTDVDFLAGKLRVADQTWFWRHAALARNVAPFRCFFPVTRLSVRAIDAVLAHRLKQGKRLTRRMIWPNDEAMVATTLMNGGFVCRDLNDFGPIFYSGETFYYGKPLDGDNLKLHTPNVQIAHPVLSGSDYQTRLLALQQRSTSHHSWMRERARWTAIKINARLQW